MSISLIPLITDAGLQAVINASNDGLQARISHIALGDMGWEPTHAATQLVREQTRVAVSNGSRIQPTQIHITAVENGAREYWVREIGFVLDDGTLFAIWSHPTQALAYKAVGVDLLLAFDLLLNALPADSVTIDGTGGVNLAPATEVLLGIVRLATQAEAEQGTLDTAVVMTPARSRLHGDARYAQRDHRHVWNTLDGLPDAFPPINHSHSWSSITSKPSVFPPAGHTHDDRYIAIAGFIITSGLVGTQNRFSQREWVGYNNFNRNYADIFPPTGYTMANLEGFFASIAIIFFGGNVNGDDNLYVRWRYEANRIRVICANSENTADSAGVGSYINYQAIWRR